MYIYAAEGLADGDGKGVHVLHGRDGGLRLRVVELQRAPVSGGVCRGLRAWQGELGISKHTGSRGP